MASIGSEGATAGGGAAIGRAAALAVRGGAPRAIDDAVAVEEPLEIRALSPGEREAAQVAVTMRTPGHDDELAVGFLHGEALVSRRDELMTRAVRELPLPERGGQVVTVCFARPFDGSALKRNFFATSSCGVCGKASIDQVKQAAPRSAPGPIVARSTLLSLPSTLRAAQEGFAATGGLHATGLFDATGTLLLAREDVGRHNAMDKVIGRRLLDGALPLAAGVLLVSGRASFELVQKAAMAGAPILCAVSAPSSLAVATAEAVGMTLVGFLRDGGFNVYCGAERIDLDR